jgi:hypothetical protein
MRPKGLKETAIIMGVFNITAYIFINYKSQHLVFMLTFFTALVLLTYVILWFYWCGNNWARILVILTSLVSLLNIWKIKEHNSVQVAIIAAEAVLGLYLQWWLNTSEVKGYFKGLKKDA